MAKLIGLMLETCDDSLLGRRDRALLATGFAAALRRSELIALQVSDLTFVERGMDVAIRRSKGDQEGRGVTLAVPHGDHLMPVAAVKDWLTTSGITEGPVFRQVKKGGRLGEAALTPHAVAVLTAASSMPSPPMLIAKQSRHKSLDMLLVYSRRVDRYRQHSGRAVL